MTIVAFRSLHGLGAFALPESIAKTLTPLSPTAAEGIMRAASTDAGEYTIARDPRAALATQAMIATGARSAPAGETVIETVASDTPCGCAVQVMADTLFAQAGVMASSADVFGMTATCEEAGYAEFIAAVDQNSPGTFDFGACQPWYKNPRNWVIGAALAGAGGLLYWSTR